MKLQKLDLDWALNAHLPELDFVLPGLLPSTLGLLIAPGATGKSTLVLDIAIAIAIGRPIAGGLFPSAKPGKVVMLAGEECSRILAERIRQMLDLSERANTDALQNLHIFPMSGESTSLVADGEATPLFSDFKNACEGARLVIVDPLRRLHTGDENSSAEMSLVVLALERIAKLSGAAVIAVHHANRSSTSDMSSQNAARGSTALVDGARWQLNLSRMDMATAKEHGISEADRAEWVALDFAKTNYLTPQPRQWLRRQRGGRLLIAELPKAVTATKASPMKRT